MSQITNTEMLASLQKDISNITRHAHQLLSFEDILNTQPGTGKWTIAQVIEHLNTYNDYYLPQINKAFENYTGNSSTDIVFKPGLIGNYLTNAMRPHANGEVLNKMKAFKKHVPAPELDAKKILNNFAKGQTLFSEILDRAAQYDLNRVKIPMSICKLVMLKLGDILQVLVVHQQRHFIQIYEAQKLIAIQRRV